MRHAFTHDDAYIQLLHMRVMDDNQSRARKFIIDKTGQA